MNRTNHYWALFSGAILALSAAWIAFSMPAPGSTTNGKIPAPRQGFLAPDFELQDTAGNSLRLSDLQGRPVLLNFWASWCPPCQAEMPAMEQVYQAYAAQGFVVLAVNTTYQDGETEALQFMQSHGLTFPVLFDRSGTTSHQYDTRALPTSYFIAPSGIIQEVVVGGPMSEALLRSQVERLLKEGQ